MYHLRQFLILWDFHQNPPLQVNEIFDERNHKFFNDEFKNDLGYSRKPFEFKIDLRDISWDDIFRIISCQPTEHLMSFTTIFLHYAINKSINLLKKDKSLKDKPWITKYVKSLMIERERHFKQYWKEYNTHLKLRVWNQQ